MSSTIEGRLYKAVKVRHLLVNLRDDPAAHSAQFWISSVWRQSSLMIFLEKLNISFKSKHLNLCLAVHRLLLPNNLSVV